MPTPIPCVTPWPVKLEAYDYLSTLNGRDWGWEALRRNPAYRAEALGHTPLPVVSTPLEGGALLTRMQARVPAAEAWALCCFCRPPLERA